MRTRSARNAGLADKMLRGMPSYDRFDRRANVVDALTNLRHYCDRHAISFDAACDSSRGHCVTESKLDARNAKPGEDGGGE